MSQRHPNALVIGTGLSLLILSFLLIYWFKYGDLSFSPSAFSLLVLLGASWLLVNLMLNLPRSLLAASLPAGMALVGKAALTLLFLVSVMIHLLEWGYLSRLLVYGPGVLFAGALWLLYGLFRIAVPVRPEATDPDQHRPWFAPSLQLMVVDGLLLLFAASAAITLGHPEPFSHPSSSDLFVLLTGFWLGTALVTGKFNRMNFCNHLEALIPPLKALGFMAGGLALVFYSLRLHDYSWLEIAAALGLYFTLEVLVFMLYVSYRRQHAGLRDLDDVAEVSRFLRKGQRDIPLPVAPVVSEPATAKVRRALAKEYPRDFCFLDQALDLEQIDRDRCVILDTDRLINLNSLDQGRQQLLINLHKLNDIRWINRYFLTAHTRLAAGGYIAGNAHTIATRRRFYAHRYPRPFDTIFYAVNFLWHRVCPKLPWLKKLYFAVTKGRNRLVSRAEILGRLYFCGFKIIAEQEKGHRFYFVAQKVKEPSHDQNPTYGPLVRLRRYGQGGRPLAVLKFRTMFPYSEYLQEYVYQRQKLDQGGKFSNDFRVTGWGQMMRRTWLDELPMIWNWVRGEMQLIGVRPLSAQYLGLYRPEVRELRAQVKPGLLPPFYADMPDSLEEIMASEARYIQAYLERPLVTQWRYFWRCFFNIVIRGKRSK